MSDQPAVADVGALEDFTEGVVATVSLGASEVGVLRWRDAVYAFANRCPHMGGPICRGRVRPWLESPTVGELAVLRDEPVLACPWHGWEFAPATGEALADDRYWLRTYAVDVEDGRVLIQTAPARRPARPRARELEQTR
jgi:nitrite reductase/ring-hydroxylating ferredoxin subunit